MNKFKALNLVASLLLIWLDMSPNSLAGSLYSSLDAGTSFSPTGIGVLVGGAFGPLYSELGYGFFAKNDRAGRPISLSLGLTIIKDFSVVGAVTRYAGKGKRTVAYTSDLQNDELNAHWEFYYTSFGIRMDPVSLWQFANLIAPSTGSIVSVKPPLVRNLKYYLTLGVSFFQKGKITVDDDFEASNLGQAKGIVIDSDAYHTGVMGPGDWGPFAAIGVSYELF